LPELRELLNRLPKPSGRTGDTPQFPLAVDDQGQLWREKLPVTELQEKEMRLLVLLVQCNYAVEVPTVEDIVWAGDNDPTPDAIRKLTSRLTRSLKTLAPGWYVKKKGLRIWLEHSVASSSKPGRA
jgi:hypothetical protein